MNRRHPRLCGIVVFGFAILVGAANAESAFAGQSLAERIKAARDQAGYASAAWGVLVVDLKTGEPIHEENADRLFCPASVTKLFTTSAALADLGADFRFRTPVVRNGTVDAGGILRGDLILIAQGDPNLGGRLGGDGGLLFEDHDHTYANGNLDATLVKADPLAGLDDLARQVKDAGIKRIAGDVVIDDRLFKHAASTGSGPARVTPIMVNDNLVDIVIEPAAKVGEPARVRIVPETAIVHMDARIETVAADRTPLFAIRELGGDRFALRGRIPLGAKPIVKVHEAADPASFARSLFIDRLEKRGVAVAASRLAANPAELLPGKSETKALKTVAEYASAPLIDEVRVILKVSLNLHASALPLIVASRHGETTLEEALLREGKNLEKVDVDVSKISFGGGAGGSRSDLVTPRQTALLLRAMARKPDFAGFESALPVLGRDGTLVDAVAAESPARGHVRAKTGTFWVENGLTGRPVLTSKALAGYMETASGRPLVVVFFLNLWPVPPNSGDMGVVTERAGKFLGKLCEICYDDASSAPSSSADK